MKASIMIKLEDGGIIQADVCDVTLITKRRPVYVFFDTTWQDEIVDIKTTYTIKAEHFQYSIPWRKAKKHLKKAGV
jgi:hypothetical protein